MKTTEPTTPQPKHAGLRTCFHCGTDLSSLPDDVFCPKCLPLPTPHAAEAGVREWSRMLDTGSVRISLCDDGSLEINDGGAIYTLSESETTAMLKWLAARHTAETVGTGDAHKAAADEIRLLESHGFKVIRNNRIDGGSCLALKSECQASIDIYDSGVRVVAIISGPDKGIYEFESALEQARSGMEDMIRTLKTVPANMARPALCEGDFIRWDKALAALNAVLPPAKGGAQG